jgi:DNA-binding NtrC family response regulator
MARKRPRTGLRTRRSEEPTFVVLVGEGTDWQAEMGTLLALEGYRIDWVPGLHAALAMTERNAVQALFVAARPLAASDVLLLGHIREASPGTAVVVVTKTPTDPDLKRAFESGATAFLSWPASTEALRQAIERGDFRPRPRPRVRRRANEGTVNED